MRNNKTETIKIKQMKYNNDQIEYILIRKRIKNIYIQIKDKKVIVKVPFKIKENSVEKLIYEKSKWIYEKLEEDKRKNFSDSSVVTEEDIHKLERNVDNLVKKYIGLTGLYPNKVRIRNIKSAWGTCSSNKNITISLRLINKSDDAIEYVVLHEICHLKHMNHSKEFWDLVEKHMPEYKKIRKEL